MAQHNHDEGHPDYSQWQSLKTTNCCNSNDCGFLNDDEWRQGPAGVEIKIRDKWCLVRPMHYIIKGKSPGWTHAHACVVKLGNFSNDCDRLPCFAGVPKT
jgi:hypothetical protein